VLSSEFKKGRSLLLKFLNVLALKAIGKKFPITKLLLINLNLMGWVFLLLLLRSDVLHILGHRLYNLTQLLILWLKMNNSVLLVPFRTYINLRDSHGPSSLINHLILIHREHSGLMILSKRPFHHCRIIDLLLYGYLLILLSKCYDLLILQVTLLSCLLVLNAVLTDVVLKKGCLVVVHQCFIHYHLPLMVIFLVLKHALHNSLLVIHH